MLHDVFFALSGYASPIFDQDGDLPGLEPSERALLKSLGRLSAVHRALKTHLFRICSNHASVVCRATANALRNSHLSKFQKTILDVERELLSNDPKLVGAYNIVPLAGIVSRFDEWKRRLDWYWNLACFMLPVEQAPYETEDEVACNSAQILDRLQQDSQTGYPDIEEAALDLLIVAQRSWMKQLSSWILDHQLDGRQQNHGRDFFIQYAQPDQRSFIDWSLVPSLVNYNTASSILFIGRTHSIVYQSSSLQSNMRRQNSNSSRPNSASSAWQKRREIFRQCDLLQDLNALKYPLSSTQFARAISDTRLKLTSLLFTEVLSTGNFIRVIKNIKLLLLGGRDDFAATLIRQADKHLSDRHQQTRVNVRSRPQLNIAGMMMTDPELGSILNRTWLALAPFVGKSEINDETLEWGRACLRLQLSGTVEAPSDNLMAEDGMSEHIQDEFREFLLSAPASLQVRLDNVFSIFMSTAELKAYSAISSYLLAIRRGQLHLAELWKDGSFRRHHPVPAGPRQVNAKYGRERASKARLQVTKRMDLLRKAWAACYNAMFVLVELGNFFADEVIPASWQAFEVWALNERVDGVSSRPATSKSDTSFRQTTGASSTQNDDETNAEEEQEDTGETVRRGGAQEDPETVANAHRQYLSALLDALFLHDKNFTRALRTLLTRVDQLVAFMRRLQTVQLSLDLENEGVELEANTNLYQDEQDLYGEVNSASSLVIRDISHMIEQMRLLNTGPPKPRAGPDSQTGFEPWISGNGMDQLLMRIDLSMMGS